VGQLKPPEWAKSECQNHDQQGKAIWKAVIADYLQAVEISRNIDNYRGMTDAGGQLAQGTSTLEILPELPT